MAKHYRVRGVKEVQRTLAKMGAAATGGLARELYREGEQIMTVSKPLVPVDTGALRSTGHVKPPEIEGHQVRVTMGYGGPAGAEVGGVYVGYALKVHEDLAAFHPTGQAKYLEQPAMEAAKGMPERVAAGLERDIASQGR